MSFLNVLEFHLFVWSEVWPGEFDLMNSHSRLVSLRSEVNGSFVLSVAERPTGRRGRGIATHQTTEFIDENSGEKTLHAKTSCLRIQSQAFFRTSTNSNSVLFAHWFSWNILIGQNWVWNRFSRLRKIFGVPCVLFWHGIQRRCRPASDRLKFLVLKVQGVLVQVERALQRGSSEVQVLAVRLAIRSSFEGRSRRRKTSATETVGRRLLKERRMMDSSYDQTFIRLIRF